MIGSSWRFLGVCCVLALTMVACRGSQASHPDENSPSVGAGTTPTDGKSVDGPLGAAFAGGTKLWPVKSGIIVVPYRFDVVIADQAARIWVANMKRWERLSGGRVKFEPVTSSPPAGDWIQLSSEHARIGRCGVGAGAPTTCGIRDSAMMGIGIIAGSTATIYADFSWNYGTKDDLQNLHAGFPFFILETPKQPGTDVPLQVASIDYEGDGKLVTWYEPDTVVANGPGSYKIWRSKGTPSDLDSGAALAEVSLPDGIDTIFTTNPPHRGSLLRGAAIKGEAYTWWDVGSQLKVARGSTTDLDSIETLKTVTLPAGKTIADLIDMSFDADGTLYSWFVDSYADYGSGIRVPFKYRRYSGTYRDLDGPSNDTGAACTYRDPETDDVVVDCKIKASNDRAALHELGHALGFIHEHQRADRDSYVWVDPAVSQSNAKDYGMIPSAVNHSRFDLASIMIYPNGSVTRLDAAHTSIPARATLSWHDVSGLRESYGLPAYTAADAWAASDAGDPPLGFSALAGMAGSDIIGGDFNKDGAFYAWYAFDGKLKRSWGHEWDLDASGDGNFIHPGQTGAFAAVLGIAIQHDDNGRVYSWYKRISSNACPSGVYRSIGTPEDLGAYSAPACVTVLNSAHGGDHIVEFAIDNYSGSDRVYTLYDDGTISVGSATNLTAFKAPSSYALPENIAPANVDAFSLFNGVAVFHARTHRVLRDKAFKNKF